MWPFRKKQLAKDLVCGMDVASEKAAATSSYQGATYYFCARGCKEEFDKEPEKYLQASQPRGHGMGH